MSKLILTTSLQREKNEIITNFYGDLGSLMKIRGFQFIKHFDRQGNITSLDWFSFSRRTALFTLELNNPELPVTQQIKPHLEKILSELSIFQLVDIFLFDELGLLEAEIIPLKQQIITIFSSRISVIGVVNRAHLAKISYLKNRAKIDFYDLDAQNQEKMYLNLIGELYDR